MYRMIMRYLGSPDSGKELSCACMYWSSYMLAWQFVYPIGNYICTSIGVHMCVCMFMYVCCVCLNVCASLCMCIYTCVCVCTHTQTQTHTRIVTQTCVHILYACVCLCMCVCMHDSTYMHIYSYVPWRSAELCSSFNKVQESAIIQTGRL